MFDAYQQAQLSACCAELKTIRTARDFYRIISAVNEKYGLDIVNAAREITQTYNTTQYKED